MTIYEELKEKIPTSQIDHHESDLYVEDTPAVRGIVGSWEFVSQIERFRSPIDNKLWLCLPFAYEPFWWAKNKALAKRTCEYGNGADCNNLPQGVFRSVCGPCKARQCLN